MWGVLSVLSLNDLGKAVYRVCSVLVIPYHVISTHKDKFTVLRLQRYNIQVATVSCRLVFVPMRFIMHGIPIIHDGHDKEN